MSILTRMTDQKGRLTLPSDFASCLVTVERLGDELRVRKARQVAARRYSFAQLMAGVTARNKKLREFDCRGDRNKPQRHRPPPPRIPATDCATEHEVDEEML